jgi:hypothetical protein
MPFPLIAHQGIAAPILLADRPRHFDCVAFMVATIAPDLPYAFDRSRFDFDSQSYGTGGLLLWCLPVSVIAAVVFRSIVARPLAVHLPDLGAFRLRDVGFAAADRPSLAVSAGSAAVGLLTHLLADSFTHPEPWAVDLFPVLMKRAPVTLPDPGPTYWYDIVHMAANVGGAVLLVLCLYLAGRSRVRQRQARPALPRPTHRSSLAFWGSVAAGAVVGLALGAYVWGPETGAQATMLFTWSVAIGTMVGSLRATRALERT